MELDMKVTEIKDVLSKKGLSYLDIPEESVDNIYSLFVLNNTVKCDESKPVELFYLGNYYQFMKKDYDLMKKYYLMAIELGNSTAMSDLGYYYKNVEKDYLMKKYYLMAIELGNSTAMHNLGFYYQAVEKDYDLMKKYYWMAIKSDNSTAMSDMGYYYKNVEKDYDLMKKYFLMAIQLGNSSAMYNLGKYYKSHPKDLSYIVSMNPTTCPELFDRDIEITEYLTEYCQLDLSKCSNDTKMRQYITRNTNIYPRNYNRDYDIHFMELLKLRSKAIPKDIIMHIAGMLYV